MAITRVHTQVKGLVVVPVYKPSHNFTAELCIHILFSFSPSVPLENCKASELVGKNSNYCKYRNCYVLLSNLRRMKLNCSNSNRTKGICATNLKLPLIKNILASTNSFVLCTKISCCNVAFFLEKVLVLQYKRCSSLFIINFVHTSRQYSAIVLV